MQLGIKIENLAEVQLALMKFPITATKYIDKAIKQSILEITERAKPLTPVKTGNLRRSYNSIFSPLKGILQPMANYAFYVEVMDKNMHTTGQAHYLETGLNIAEQAINKYFQKAINDTLNEVAKSV